MFLRQSLFYSGHCVATEDHGALRGFAGTFPERCSQFIGLYCSKLGDGDGGGGGGGDDDDDDDDVDTS